MPRPGSLAGTVTALRRDGVEVRDPDVLIAHRLSAPETTITGDDEAGRGGVWSS